MYELIQAAANTYYINCPAKIGIYRANDKDVYLIDSGNDKDAGKKVRRILDAQGWQLKAIINTHSHADHIGGNRALQQACGCPVFAAGIESAFTNYPILEASFVYGGFPCKDLRHKFLLAQESRALDVTDPSFPEELNIIPLPGHSFSMIGVRTPDQVVFLADCVSSETTLEKYQLAFLYDVAAYLQTLDLVEQMEADFFVPAHADAAKDVKELVRLNRRKVFEIGEKILELAKTPVSFETLLKMLFDAYALTLNFEQYALVGSTVRSYLAWLKDSGRIDVIFEENYLKWQAL